MEMFMVEIGLPYYKDEEFMALIPRQREQIGTLLQTGILLSFSLNQDRTKIWIVMAAQNEDAALKVLEQLALFKFMDLDLQSLMAFDRGTFSLPPLVMN
ncbi:MAG: hypothetical protein Q8916_03425 [Bacteroidota bacterium]|nr:hypothetical protein [Bacteroidota bacterium]MDP4236572.1 hypothetical protein [Bacteroidota bacterium]